MSRTLFEISSDIQALDDLLFELGGDVSDENAAQFIDEWLQENADALAQKLDGYAAIIANRQSFAAARRKKARELELLAKADENTATRLKERLKMFFEARGMAKFETIEHKFAVSKNGGKVPLLVHAGADIPPQFQKISVAPDGEAIRAALDAGEVLGFACLGEAGTHLRIR